MKNGIDRKDGATQDDHSNVVSLKSARDLAAAKVRQRTGQATRETPRITLGQWIVGGLFMLMAIGGAVALVRPLVKGAGIAGGWGIG